MFIIVDMRDTVRIPPHAFNSELLALSAALDEKYSNKVFCECECFLILP